VLNAALATKRNIEVVGSARDDMCAVEVTANLSPDMQEHPDAARTCFLA
jgi:hypothetical protein